MELKARSRSILIIPFRKTIEHLLLLNSSKGEESIQEPYDSIHIQHVPLLIPLVNRLFLIGSRFCLIFQPKKAGLDLILSFHHFFHTLYLNCYNDLSHSLRDSSLQTSMRTFQIQTCTNGVYTNTWHQDALFRFLMHHQDETIDAPARSFIQQRIFGIKGHRQMSQRLVPWN